MKRRKKYRLKRRYAGHWADSEIAALRRHWHDLGQRGLHSAITAAHPRRLRRTWLAIVTKAWQLGLPLTVPNGYLSIREAAERAGFSWRFMMRILREQGVQIQRRYIQRRYSCSSRKRRLPRYIVDEFEAMRAVEVHLENAPQSANAWARQLGLEHWQFANHARALFPGKATKKFWRLTSEQALAVKARIEAYTAGRIRFRPEPGTVIGLVTVLRIVRIDNCTRVLCRCVCGKEIEKIPSVLRRGLSRTCGRWQCRRNLILSQRPTQLLAEAA